MEFIVKLFKNILGIFLLPFCVGAVIALYKVVLFTGSAWTIWITTLAGVLCWLFIFFFLPEPKWLYVLGHEMTHALWSGVFGGKLKEMKVDASGGHVLTTKSNFITSLAPYFFPLYVFIIVIIFSIGKIFSDWSNYVLIFYFLVGMAYAFHITLTYRILKIEQPDIVKQGYIFSASIIFLGNMCVLLISIPLLTGTISVHDAFNMMLTHSAQIYNYISNLIK